MHFAFVVANFWCGLSPCLCSGLTAMLLLGRYLGYHFVEHIPMPLLAHLWSVVIAISVHIHWTVFTTICGLNAILNFPSNQYDHATNSCFVSSMLRVQVSAS